MKYRLQSIYFLLLVLLTFQIGKSFTESQDEKSEIFNKSQDEKSEILNKSQDEKSEIFNESQDEKSEIFNENQDEKSDIDVEDHGEKSDIFIESPHITNWGSWGQLDLCPNGTYASGMQLKIENYQESSDDTALNGIRLFCVSPGSNDFDKAVNITSTVSGWGSWKKPYYCDKGVIVGFQLKSEPQISGDNTAANNLRILCSNLKGGFLEGDGQSWGTWTETQTCLSQQAVCGIETQVQPWAQGGDDTSINNIKMKCCEIANIGRTCEATDEWETIFECDNTKGLEPLTCTYQKTRGISASNSASESMTEEYNIMLSVGFSASAMFSGLSMNFKENLNISEVTGYSWATESSEMWSEATTVTAEFKVPGGMKSKLSQAVGRCGLFGVFSNYFQKVDSNQHVSLENYFYD